MLNVLRTLQVMEIIANWHPDNSSVPPRYYDSICRFDYTTEWHKAMAYRDAEVRWLRVCHRLAVCVVVCTHLGTRTDGSSAMR